MIIIVSALFSITTTAQKTLATMPPQTYDETFLHFLSDDVRAHATAPPIRTTPWTQCPPGKRVCCMGLATALWMGLLLQLFAVVLSLLRQILTCGWDDPLLNNPHNSLTSSSSSSFFYFCFPLKHPIMEGAVLALLLGILWLALFLSWALMEWACHGDCRIERQQYRRHDHHHDRVWVLEERPFRRRRSMSLTVSSSSCNNSVDSDETTPLVVYVV